VVAVGGCWAQSQKEAVFREFPFVDIAFGPGEVARLGELVARERLDAIGAFSFDGAFSGDLPSKRERPHQAWVQISVGCNCVCAYCIVPSVRGRERSRPVADVVAEVTALAADGVREVTLLGQNVNSYGRDLPREERLGFAGLLRAVAGVPGVDRVRYTSPHPKDMKADVIAAMAECPEVCEHLHLPAQSGSTRILKAMRRTYSRERYLELVGRLREAIPDLSLTTDLIVGFPGEREDDFAETLSLVEEVGYDGAYTFLYSPRPGTEAAETLPDDVSSEVKRERIGRLVELVQRTAAARAARFVGSEREVLVEGPSRTDPSRLRGRLSQNIAVNFTGTAAPGSMTRVLVEGATSTTLTGRQAAIPARADLLPA
jgi:tRNA-2-methylthio-N6-dimethylallyladenosine synthase